MAHIGIDIGTSYSSVCILNENGQPERVKIATGTGVYGDSFSLPSAVFLEEDGRLLLGQAAFASRMRAPQNFKAEFKRDLGQTTPYLLGGLQYMPEDLYKEFFIYIKKCVEDYTYAIVSSATVTYPAMFNDNKKKLIEKAAKAAGLLDVQLIDEPSAAAYCYLNAGKLSEGDTLLVYDLGGGTFDLALMRVKNGRFMQLTQPMGNPRLGGVDFDRMIFNDIMTQIGEDMMAPIKANPIYFSRFAASAMELAVKAKHHLSSSGVFADFITVGYGGVDYTLDVSRYSAMIASVIGDTMKQVRMLLQAADLKPSDVNMVLLVGGASRTPLVREMLTKELGQEPFKDVDPELAVCIGAAICNLDGETITAKKEDELSKTPEGQCILGCAYYHGKSGKKQDYDMAMHYFRRAADQNHAKAQYMLGLCYENGNGTAKKTAKAVEWFGKAADGGNIDSQLVIASYYEKGYGVNKNKRKSIEFYNMAAAQGSGEAMMSLGRIVSDEDYSKALEWYMKAAAQGCEGARNMVAATEEAIAEEEKRRILEEQKRIADIRQKHSKKIQTLCAGNSHTIGLKTDGTVVAAGSNKFGQCNVDKWWHIVAVSAGAYSTIGIKGNGTVLSAGNNEYGQCDVSDWRDIIAVSAGNYHTAGLKSDGTVVAVGHNSAGQCDVNGWKDIISVVTGNSHTVGLKSDGTVVAVGDNGDGRCNVSGWKDIISICAGHSHTLGLKLDGTVVAAGWNKAGACDVNGWRNIVSVCAGQYCSVGIKSNGTVATTVTDDIEYVSGWRDIIAVCAGMYHTVGLRADGTVVSVYNELTKQIVSDWRDIIAVLAGGYHTIGLRADGTVVATGDNDKRQCDVSGWRNIRIPQ